MGINKVLFVCTGNTCRSVMAEYLFNKYNQNPSYTAFSAGVMAENGDEATALTCSVLKDENLDANAFSSSCLTPEMIDEAVAVYVMEKRHYTLITQSFFDINFDKIKVLNNPVPDPFGRDINFYKETLALIKKEVMDIINELPNN